MERSLADMDRQIFERFNASKKPVDADGHISCGRMDHARGHHRGLLGNHCEYIRRAQAERSELVLVHLDDGYIDYIFGWQFYYGYLYLYRPLTFRI